MIFSKTLSRALVAALAFSLCAIPAVASAQPGPGPNDHAEVAKGAKGKKKLRRFPMKGERFVELVANRIKKMEARIDARLKRRNVPPELQSQIKGDFAKASTKIMGAAEKAAADGTVTKQEAKKVRQLAKKMKQQARKKYGKRNRGKGWGKGGSPANHGKQSPGGPGRF